VEAVVGLVHLQLEAQAQRMGQHVQPLDLPAHAEQAPAVVAGHAVGLGAGDGRQVGGGLGQHSQHVGHRCVAFTLRQHHAHPPLELVAHLVDQLPVLGRQALAQVLGTLAQAAQVVRDAGGAAHGVGVELDGGQA